MTSIIDIDRLALVLREAAEAEIMPRFRALGAADVREKTSAIDLVTQADEAAECFIKAECARLFPTATFIGEESAAADPALFTFSGRSICDRCRSTRWHSEFRRRRAALRSNGLGRR